MAPSDPVFNPRPYRHYRQRYSVVEARWGALALGGLVAVGGWIAWRGTQPLEGMRGGALPSRGETVNPPRDEASPQQPLTEAAPAGAPEVMTTLQAGAGWRASRLSSFNSDNLYEKINGRAGFFLSRGFSRLWSITLSQPSSDSTIELELYDMASAENARGIYAAERSSDIPAQTEAGGQWHRDRNAVFVARGPYYLRALGSSEEPAVLAELERQRAHVTASIQGQQASGLAGLLTQRLGVAPGTLEFEKENAFSFSFGLNVTLAPVNTKTVPSEHRKALSEAEWFLTPAPAADADALAARYREGFASIGSEVPGPPLGKQKRQTWIKNRYLPTFASAMSVQPPSAGGQAVVAGVRRAGSVAAGHAALQALAQALDIGLSAALSEGAPASLAEPAAAEQNADGTAAEPPAAEQANTEESPAPPSGAPTEPPTPEEAATEESLTPPPSALPEPPATEPPATEPPATEPPATESPATEESFNDPSQQYQ